MAKAKLGTKRVCTSCSLRYYDLNKIPISCPSCGAEFDHESLLKMRKSRQAVKLANDYEGVMIEAESAKFAATDVDQSTDETLAGSKEAVSSDLSYEENDHDEVDEETGGLIQDDISADDEFLNNIPNSDDN